MPAFPAQQARCNGVLRNHRGGGWGVRLKTRQQDRGKKDIEQVSSVVALRVPYFDAREIQKKSKLQMVFAKRKLHTAGSVSEDGTNRSTNRSLRYVEFKYIRLPCRWTIGKQEVVDVVTTRCDIQSSIART